MRRHWTEDNICNYSKQCADGLMIYEGGIQLPLILLYRHTTCKYQCFGPVCPLCVHEVRLVQRLIRFLHEELRPESDSALAARAFEATQGTIKQGME